MTKFFGIITALALLASSSAKANASIVINGEFETPTITANGGDWEVFSPGIIGWTNPGDGVELWRQGFLSSPVNGSDNLPTGQSMELNAHELGVVSQPVPVGVSLLSLTFDAWLRGNATAVLNVTGSVSGPIISGYNILTNLSPSEWTPNSLIFNVLTSETIKLEFKSTSGDSANSVHIDQVSLSAVPEPMTLVVWSGLAAIGGIVAYRRRRLA